MGRQKTKKRIKSKILFNWILLWRMFRLKSSGELNVNGLALRRTDVDFKIGRTLGSVDVLNLLRRRRAKR